MFGMGGGGFSPSFTSTATSGSQLNSSGSTNGYGAGGWNIDLGGSGTAFQGAGGVPWGMLAVAAVVLGAMWFLKK